VQLLPEARLAPHHLLSSFWFSISIYIERLQNTVAHAVSPPEIKIFSGTVAPGHLVCHNCAPQTRSTGKEIEAGDPTSC